MKEKGLVTSFHNIIIIIIIIMCAKWSTAIKIASVKWVVVHHSVKIVILLEFPDDKKNYLQIDCRLSTNTLLTVWLNEGSSYKETRVLYFQNSLQSQMDNNKSTLITLY